MKLGLFLQDTFSPQKGSIKVPIKGTIEGYRERYNQLKSDSSKLFQHKIYVIQPKNRTIVHIKVPSETVAQFHYDILLELDIPKKCTDFADCDIKVFSNCPSFVYSYAYIFAHWDGSSSPIRGAMGKGMLIDVLKGKLPRERMLIPGSEGQLGKKAVHDQPVIRNPIGIPLFDKSIYFAIFYLMENLTPEDVAKSHNYRSAPQVFASVTPFDSLMVQRKRLENRQKDRTAKAQKKVQSTFETHERSLAQKNLSGMMQPKRAKTVTSTISTARSMKTTSKPRTNRTK